MKKVRIFVFVIIIAYCNSFFQESIDITRLLSINLLSVSVLSLSKVIFENTYCNCSGKYGKPPWCTRRSSKINESYCILNGHLMSRACPKASRVRVSGKWVNEYFTSDPSVCDRAACKYSIDHFIYLQCNFSLETIYIRYINFPSN